VIPQVITNDADVFICSKVCSFQRTQLELGLSLPMVTKSGMGSGLISNTEKINHILERAHTESDILVSMKMRLVMNRLKKLLMYFLFLTNIL
jgi:hypothetical protein